MRGGSKTNGRQSCPRPALEVKGSQQSTPERMLLGMRGEGRRGRDVGPAVRRSSGKVDCGGIRKEDRRLSTQDNGESPTGGNLGGGC